MSNSMILVPSHDDPRLAYLIDQQSFFLLVATFGGMLVLLVFEQLWPRRHDVNVPVKHWLTNWLLGSFNFFVLFWLTLQLGNWTVLRSYFPDPGFYERLSPIVALPLIVVLVEFASYWVHRLFHRVSTFWHMHAVHHTDTTFDVTTSQRHHTAEVAIDTIILLPIFLLFGAPPLVLVFYQLARVFLVLFNHSNIYLSAAVDRVLRKIIVTPDFHRLHHSPDPQFTNSNFGTVVPWFDYVFGTARSVPFENAAAMPVGLEYLRKDGDSRFDRLLLLPLMWRRWGLPGRN
jgi:sterol desaturase/sphingolipid hydroxylase (fatty acid hydroxylase superfamily)